MARQRSQHPHRQELQAIFALHAQGLEYFAHEKIDASRECFFTAFSLVTKLLRETRNRDILFYRGSPLARESDSSPTFASSCRRELSLDCDQGDNRQEEEQHESMNRGLDNAASQPCITNTLLSTDDVSLASASSSSSSTTLEDLPMFALPLQIPKLVTIQQFVFISLYNLALSTHLSALSHPAPEKQEVLMKRAVKQWGLVYALQWRQGLNLRAPHGLAILLNLGHANCLTGNIPGSNACYQNILSAIHILDSRKQGIPNKAFFLYNAFRMLSAKSTTIAAAVA